MPLAFATYGEGRPILILHGLFGSGRNWTSMAKRLAETGRQAVTVDLRNHGGSPHNPVMDYPTMAADVRELIAAEKFADPVIIGHSMGGKTAMALALEEPSLLSALVVVDIAPESYDHSNADLIDAMQEIDLGKIANRRAADAALAETVSDPGVRAFLLQNLDFDGSVPVWRLNHNALRDNMPNLTDFPCDPASQRYDGPALFIAGANSEYMKNADRRRIRNFFPAARIATIKGAGHWVHAEAPDAFFEIAAGFLSTLDE